MIPKPVQDFTSIFNSMPGLTLVLKPDFSIAAVSDAYQAAAKTSKESLIGHNLFEFFFANQNLNGAKDRQTLKDSLNYVLKHGKEHAVILNKCYTNHIRGIFKEKKINLRHTPFFNAQNKISYIAHTIQAKESLHTPETNDLPEVINSNNMAVFLIDPNGKVASWNSHAAHLNGYTATDIMGKPIDIFYSAEDRLQRTPRKNLQTALQNGCHQTEGWRLRKDGSSFYAKIVVTVQTDTLGNITGYTKMVTPVTSKKVQEEDICGCNTNHALKKIITEKQVLAQRMAAILNTLPANIALLDKNGIITDVNKAWRNFANGNLFYRGNYGVGENYLEFTKSSVDNSDKDGLMVIQGVKAVLANKTKEFDFEYTCHSKEKQRWFRMVVLPIQNTQIEGALIMHVDVSEIKRLEQERLKIKTEEHKKITQAILQGQEKERNHIGRELHDNITQLLASTKLFLSFAASKNEVLKDLIKYPLELLDSSVEEIRSLCKNLVTPLKDIDLEDLVKGLVVKMEQAVPVKTRLSYTVRKDLLSDDLKLNIYRILQELLNNIQKYAMARQVSITIEYQDNKLYITVQDDGVGFDSTCKSNGIGLSNITNRLESFDGTIVINTSKGNGCTTNITIPC